MKQPYALSSFIVLLALFTLAGCAADGSGDNSATAVDNSVQQVGDHRPDRDTVDWQSASTGTPAWSSPVDREWPGEEIGVIGPIIAMGGRGASAFVAIYDPGGVFIGALTLEDARQDPSRLENLLRLARLRGAVQNSRTIDQVSLLRFLTLASEARQEVAP